MHDSFLVTGPMSNEAALTGGLFFGFGDDEVTMEQRLPSEYGVVPTTGYVSLSLFS